MFNLEQQGYYFGPDYLKQGSHKIELDRIEHARKTTAEPLLHANRMDPFRQAHASMPTLKSQHLNLNTTAVQIGKAGELNAAQTEQLNKGLKIFIPWKKGPYNLFGTMIDSEWQSNLKWDRIFPQMPAIKDKRIGDIGCHNGYFMFRAAAHQPACIIGFDPHPRHFFHFHLMQRYAQLPNIHFEPLGVNIISHYPAYFDIILCLGLLYHLTNPIDALRDIHSALSADGQIIVDCQGIAGDQPLALVPQGRYAQARGIWFLPTLPCLTNWLIRAGFSNINCFYAKPLTPHEQRPTPWAPIKSLDDFLDPKDASRTIEGYPAPWRFYLTATKKP